MAKTTVAKLFEAYREASRLQLVHYGDEVGKRASKSSCVLVFALSDCQAEIEIAPEVEKAIQNVS